jgi:hypothetical protein
MPYDPLVDFLGQFFYLWLALGVAGLIWLARALVRVLGDGP